MAESMNKLLFAGATTLAGALVFSHGTAFADDNPEMTNLLRSSAKYNYQIVDAAGLKASETAKAAESAEDSDTAKDSAPRRRKRDGDRAAKASRTEASRRAASDPAASTPFQETAYYPRSGPAGPWTGVYLGLNAGGVMQSRQTVATKGLDTYNFSNSSIGTAFAASAASSVRLNGGTGFIGGGQIGYNYQINNVVLGFEADFQGTTANGSGGAAGASYTDNAALGASLGVTLPPSTPVTLTRAEAGLINFGTVRARAGYLVTPTLLAYVTGGFAYGQTHVGASLLSLDTTGVFAGGSGATSYGSVHGGWTAGAGVEWMFWPRWSAKLEYLYYDLGAPPLGMTGIGYTISGATPAPVWAYLATTTPPRFSGSIVRAGVNYHLDWGIPGSIIRAAD
jgi:outer membrane immunogenic protein